MSPLRRQGLGLRSVSEAHNKKRKKGTRKKKLKTLSLRGVQTPWQSSKFGFVIIRNDDWIATLSLAMTKKGDKRSNKRQKTKEEKQNNKKKKEGTEI